MTEFDKLVKITGEEDEELLYALYTNAQAQVLAYTNRTKMIAPLMQTTLDMAVMAYNRLGTQGEKGRSEAGENYQFLDFPESVRVVLDRYRLARVGGKVYEADEA